MKSHKNCIIVKFQGPRMFQRSTIMTKKQENKKTILLLLLGWVAKSLKGIGPSPINIA
jgi:hypothetical protein